ALVRRHPQRAADALENVGGHLNVAPLLEPRVPGDADTGERSHVFSAQPRRAAAVRIRQSHLRRREPGAATLQEINELTSLRFGNADLIHFLLAPLVTLQASQIPGQAVEMRMMLRICSTARCTDKTAR